MASGAVPMALLLSAVITLPVVDSHAWMVQPPARQPSPLYSGFRCVIAEIWHWWLLHGLGRDWQVGCINGCECAGRGTEEYPTPEKLGCNTPLEPTNNSPNTRSWNVLNNSPEGDWTKYFPWQAQGHAQPMDACCVASGFKAGEDAFGSQVPGYKQGTPGQPVLFLSGSQTQVLTGYFGTRFLAARRAYHGL
eukprot:2588186-Rhodomonas_salina.1